MLWCDAAKYAGGFVNCLKPSVQLMHEASQIMMHGGGVELYMLQEPDGGVDIKKLDKFKETFDYCRKYREYLFGSESLSQIAVLFDGKTAMKMNNKAYGFFEGSLLDGINGILQCFADSQQSVDVIGEWELDNPALQYKLIVVPEWAELSCKDKLLAFAENGGSRNVWQRKRRPVSRSYHSKMRQRRRKPRNALFRRRLYRSGKR